MVNQGIGRLFKRKDGKYLIYLPKDLCEDSAFPFKNMYEASPRSKDAMSIKVNVSFSTAKKAAPIALIVTPLKQPQ